MKALLVVPRLPGTGFTGDRVRQSLHARRAGFGRPPRQDGELEDLRAGRNA